MHMCRGNYLLHRSVHITYPSFDFDSRLALKSPCFRIHLEVLVLLDYASIPPILFLYW